MTPAGNHTKGPWWLTFGLQRIAEEPRRHHQDCLENVDSAPPVERTQPAADRTTQQDPDHDPPTTVPTERCSGTSLPPRCVRHGSATRCVGDEESRERRCLCRGHRSQNLYKQWSSADKGFSYESWRHPVPERQSNMPHPLLHSGETRTPVYVAQRLNRRVIEQADETRADKFFADARLPAAERAELEDYKRSGYSRGHMALARDMSTPMAMAQSFSLANMVPQNIQHNGGAWARIEQDTRRYVLRAEGDVYVITGPVYTRTSPSIGANEIRVLAYLYKLVYDATTQRAWAHWQANQKGERVAQPISYQELVRRTGINFSLKPLPQP